MKKVIEPGGNLLKKIIKNKKIKRRRRRLELALGSPFSTSRTKIEIQID